MEKIILDTNILIEILKNSLKLILLMLLTLTTLNATTISGIGYASLESEAKKEALADLSNKISVNVKSNFETVTKVFQEEYSKSKEKMVNLSSDLPIVGATFDTLQGDTLVKTSAILNSKISLKLYQAELQRLANEINKGQKELANTKNQDIQYTLLNNLLKDIQNYEKHKVVAIILGSTDNYTLPITKSEIIAKIQKLQTNIDTLSIAADILTKNIKVKNIYLSPIKPNGSHEVTQFAKLLKSKMMTQLKSVDIPKNAEYFLKGDYEILKDSLFVTLKLYDQNNNIVLTNTANLNTKAYQNTKYKPTTQNFDTALNNQFVKSGDFVVNIGFKGYNRTDGIDLNSGDTVDIVVKTNKPMCYFLLGHTLKTNDTFSYLLPIGSDNFPYINYITGEDVNRLVTITDEVPVEAPFGNENLQIFSRTLEKDGKCSLAVPVCVENEDGYCVVGSDPSQAVAATRGLNIKKKKFKVEQSEASISFTSFKEGK